MSQMSKNREQRAIEEIDCPRCHTPAGYPCRRINDGTRPLRPTHGPPCCQERRVANQERRRLAGLAGPIEKSKEKS
jgi:hypothetical protein